MKIIFIAGPYFGDGTREAIERNIREAEKYQIALANKQIGFFCAHNHTEHFQVKAASPEEFYYKLDLELLSRSADAVLAVPGWEKSTGAKREVEWAKENSLPVFYPKDPSGIGDIVEWART